MANEKSFNPFSAMLQQTSENSTQQSVKQENSTIAKSVRSCNPFARFTQPAIKQETAVVPVDITVGDEIVQNLLREQDNPLELQEKLKALFSYEQPKDDQFPINGEQLHEFLGVATDYRKWFPRQAEAVTLIEDEDFKTSTKIVRRADGTVMPNAALVHMLTVEAAKEIAVVQKSPLGKLVRKYLFWAEEKLREVTTVISQQQTVQPLTAGQAIMEIGKAMMVQEQKISDIVVVQTKQQDQLDQVTADLAALKARVESRSIASVLTEQEAAYNPVTAEGTTTVAETADIFKSLGYDIGRNKLYDYLVENDMVSRFKNKGYKAKKRFTDLGWFLNSVEFVDLPTGVTIEQYRIDITPMGRQGLLVRLEGGRR